MHNVWGIILAGGSGKRFGGSKQYAKLDGRRLVDHCVELAVKVCTHSCLVLPQSDIWDGRKVDLVVEGGSTHAESTRNAVLSLPSDTDLVFITGVSHPLIDISLAEEVITTLTHNTQVDACAPLLHLADAVKRVDSQRMVRSIQDMHDLHTAQYPLAIRYTMLRKAIEEKSQFREELEAVQAIGGTVLAVEADPANIHITSPRDLLIAEAIIKAKKTSA